MIAAQANYHLKSLSPMSHSAYVGEPKLDGENDEAWEERNCSKRLHVQENEIIIPPTLIKKAIDATGSRLGLKIKGRGMKTWGPILKSGLMIVDPVRTGLDPSSAVYESILCSSQPSKPNSGRVKRIYPRIDSWEGELTIHVLDPMITEAILTEHIVACGLFNGLGRWRAEKGGMFGRFEATLLEWTDLREKPKKKAATG